MSEVAELLDLLDGMDPAEKNELTKMAVADAGERIWLPNAGPQSIAYFSQADELYYGGQAGGGKSDLIIGLALNEHKKSLILRRFVDDANDLAERTLEIIGSRDGYNGQNHRLRRSNGQVLDFGGVKEEDDKQRYKGKPHDLKAFDELPDFLESQYAFIIAWNRSVDPEQRCRVVGAGNPPTNPEGVWVIRYWAPWLDPAHPDPAEDGELRWYTTIDGVDNVEVDGPGPHLIGGEPVVARSRTFIRSKLGDNPDLAATDYDAVLAKLPKEFRDAYRDGRFDLGLKDQAHQVIPTGWIKEAQKRWEPTPPRGIPMCAIGVDIAQGGVDNTVLAPRHDGWFATLELVPGTKTPDGPSAAGLVMSKRRHGATIILDMGGGYGGSCRDHLIQNGIKPIAYKGSEKSERSSRDKQFGFYNKRAEAYWRFREALDPSEYQGSPIALPEDPLLVSDLSAPQFKLVGSKIKITPKEEIVKKLGRSPDRGDAVVMSWFDGPTAKTHLPEWRPDQRVGTIGGHTRVPKVLTKGPGQVRRRR